jgi:hypothetical protein
MQYTMFFSAVGAHEELDRLGHSAIVSHNIVPELRAAFRQLDDRRIAIIQPAIDFENMRTAVAAGSHSDPDEYVLFHGCLVKAPRFCLCNL